ncbi:SEC14-like protein 3 [Tribolium castaneum]|uniref:SEC14-like protein 3 n=1 Tax=Tribolium castaneum TaxID=7070 RepID=UPI00077DBE13|nr:PREDICTED: SEC14-like protein 3 isoform X1 [Tribolium castaneum]XP_015840071.1 PREDICTED: SEC14-like protein 3 isoform X2 [Tribolium castaneum]|eukprot:XP_015840070.1 PREDICTED: SEC14-like protein 3 isoform X1 [Tribolium castaneum]
MASNDETLDDHQRFVLMKFRRNVSDITQPHHDDKFLLRWLRARSWDAEAAEKMLRQSMKWRQQWEVDGALKNWQPSESLLNFYPCGVSGYDKDGAPVIIVPFGGLDMVGILHAFGRNDLIKLTIQTLERFMELAAEKGGHKFVVIFDMDAFNIRQYAWRPAAEVVVSLVQMYEANYPEILKACYIINAPRVFAIAFNVIKRFLNEYTLGKIQIFKNDPKKWKKAVLANIEPDNLPEHFGGTLADPDGNPRYTTKINQGGKVPKELYKTTFDISSTTRQFTTAVIKKGEKLKLDFIVVEEGSFLKWEFRTEAHDIRFGISLIDAEGNVTPVIHHKRVAAHQIDESGVIACQAPATYTVTFDNTYSLLRSKKIHYEIHIAPPLGKLDILPNEDEINGNVKSEIATTSAQ